MQKKIAEEILHVHVLMKVKVSQHEKNIIEKKLKRFMRQEWDKQAIVHFVCQFPPEARKKFRTNGHEIWEID